MTGMLKKRCRVESYAKVWVTGCGGRYRERRVE